MAHVDGGDDDDDGDGDGDEDGVEPVARPAVVLSREERSRLIGSIIYVDAAHADFQARWRGVADARLRAYLSTLVASHYRERAYEAAARQRVDCTQCHQEMLDAFCRLEEALMRANARAVSGGSR